MNLAKHIAKTSMPFFILGILFIIVGCADPAPVPPPVVEKQPIEVCDKNEIQHPRLVTVKQAQALLNESDHIFVEVSKEKEYDKGHIPNALHIWRPDFRTKQKSPITGMRSNPEEFIEFLQNLGMEKTSTLIVYDAKGGSDALRLAWVLDYYGFQNYKVINGGKKAWTLAGYPLSKKQSQPEKNADYTFEFTENENILATYKEVMHAIRDTQTIIIDTREDYEHEGQCFVHQGNVLAHKKGAFDRGCIPTSIHLNWSSLSDLSNDHRVKCPKDLKYDLRNKGITKNKNIIVYCQSGSRSSHTAFVLKEILEYPNVKNYDGSWIEWSYLAQQKNMPIQKITNPENFKKEMQRLTNTIGLQE